MLNSAHASQHGYRFDGLYRVDSYWRGRGKDGFYVWRYRLVRLEGQPPLGQREDDAGQGVSTTLPGTRTPDCADVTVSRVIRNTAVGRQVKQLHSFAYQVCGVGLETPSGPYAECCHIRPLGRPHDGPYTPDNIPCLCPNCHVLFDAHAIAIDDDLTIREIGEQMRTAKEHPVDVTHIQYHRHLGPQISDGQPTP